jgi:hypothetical protein
VQELVEIIKNIQFFKDRPEIQPKDFKELVSVMQSEKFNPHEAVMYQGDKGDKFYVILKGSVSVHIRNPIIKEWKIQWLRYKELKRWKAENFDKRANKAREQYMDSYQTQVTEYKGYSDNSGTPGTNQNDNVFPTEPYSDPKSPVKKPSFAPLLDVKNRQA